MQEVQDYTLRHPQNELAVVHPMDSLQDDFRYSHGERVYVSVDMNMECKSLFSLTWKKAAVLIW